MPAWTATSRTSSWSAEHEPKGVEFTVYDRSDSAPVGTAGLLGISHAHGCGELVIALGERRGQGLGASVL